jgi:hypothetical protein
VHAEGEEGLTRHLTKTGTLEQGAVNSIGRGAFTESDGSYDGRKQEVSPV